MVLQVDLSGGDAGSRDSPGNPLRSHPGAPRFSFRLEDGYPGGVPGLDGLCHAAVLSDHLPFRGDPGIVQQGQLVPDDGG